MKLTYKQLIIDNLRIFFLGDPDSVKDMENYIFYHLSTGLQLSAMMQRAKMNHMLFFVDHAVKKNKNYIGFWVTKHRIRSSGLLLNTHDFISCIYYMRPDETSAKMGLTTKEKISRMKLVTKRMQDLFGKGEENVKL